MLFEIVRGIAEIADSRAICCKSDVFQQHNFGCVFVPQDGLMAQLSIMLTARRDNGPD